MHACIFRLRQKKRYRKTEKEQYQRTWENNSIFTTGWSENIFFCPYAVICANKYINVNFHAQMYISEYKIYYLQEMNKRKLGKWQQRCKHWALLGAEMDIRTDSCWEEGYAIMLRCAPRMKESHLLAIQSCNSFMT